MSNLHRLAINTIRLSLLLIIFISIVNIFIELYLNSGYKKNKNLDLLIDKVKVDSKENNIFLRNHAKDQVDGSKKIHFHYALGYVTDYTEATTFKGDEVGRRITPEKYLIGKKNQGVVFGSSVSWGYFIPDEKIFSNILNNQLIGNGIDNYSIPGKTLEQLRLYLRYNENIFSKKDYFILVGGGYDVAKYCQLEPMQLYTYYENIQLGITRLINTVSNKKYGSKNVDFCKKDEEIDIVVQRILNSIESFSDEATRLNKPLLIVIPPVPFIGNPNITNIADAPDFKKLNDIYAPVFSALNKKINSKKYPYVLNLMNKFSDGGLYFLDAEGHLNENGHKEMAKLIIEMSGDFIPKN